MAVNQSYTSKRQAGWNMSHIYANQLFYQRLQVIDIVVVYFLLKVSNFFLPQDVHSGYLKVMEDNYACHVSLCIKLSTKLM